MAWKLYISNFGNSFQEISTEFEQKVDFIVGGIDLN